MDNIGDILSSLSDKDIENLKEAAQSIFGDSAPQHEEKQADSGFPDLSSLDPKMIGKITKIMSSMNKRNPRCDLIAALKPLLSQEKQHKADEALQVIKMIDLIPLLKDMK